MEVFIYKKQRKKMIMFSNKNKPVPTEFIGQGSPAQNRYRGDPINTKNLTYATPLVITPKRIPQEIAPDELKTPKSARPLNGFYANTNSPFSKSIITTPEKDRNKQSTFFNARVKVKENEILEANQPNSLTHSKDFLKIIKTDRSQKNLKTNPPKECTGKHEIEKAKLRQTVNTVSSGQYKTLNPYSPFKSTNEVAKNVTPKKDDPFFRKKIQSEYNPSTPQETPRKQMKLKFATLIHSRIASNAEKLPCNSASTGNLNFKLKNLNSTKITPHSSKDKLTMSSYTPKDKTMNQTDPNGSHLKVQNTSRNSCLSKPKETNQLKLQDFELGSCKGEGRFGKVFPARHKKTGCLVAIKQIKKQSVKLMLNQFIQELKISLFVNHPNVVKMYGCFHDRLNFYIVMEYMEEGSLYKVIKTNKKLSERDVVAKLNQICESVKYLHELDILHRDIKPENIVITNGVCKLCDFGWATYSKERRSTYCGTLDYVCPQILQGQTYDNFVDIWAIGVLAYEMLTGKAPFYHISRKQTMKNIMKCDFTFPADMSLSAKLFIAKALQKNPDQRFTIELLLHDNYLVHANEKK